MKPINLIPAARMEARRRRAHWLRCAGGCAAYSVLLLVACVLARLAYGKGDPTVHEKLAESETVVNRTGKSIITVNEQLAVAEATLRASRSRVSAV